MTIREFYLQRQKEEVPVFMKVLEALPKDRLDYKPDDHSPSAEQIVLTMTQALQVCLNVLADGKGRMEGSTAACNRRHARDLQARVQ